MTQMDLFQTATSYPVAIPANHLVRPGSDEARKMTAISGRKYLPLFKQNAPLGLFARMFLDTSVWASTRCFLTWKIRPVTQSKHFVLVLYPWMPRTEDLESGLWATPRTTDGTGGPNKLDEKGRRISQTNPDLVFGAKLADQVKMWPTPTASQARSEGSIKQMRQKVYAGEVTREEAEAMIGGSLEPARMKKMWPTPTANEDACGTPNGKMQKMLGNHPEVRNTGVGTLNPQWVEWLMGYPEGWTDLKD